MNHLKLDAEQFENHFPESPFQVKHSLSGMSLFALPRLVELSKNLPVSMVEYNVGNISVAHGDKRTPQTGLSVEETIERIENSQSWMVLKRVDKDPEYRALLDECLDQVAEHTSGHVQETGEREAFIFISSPNSVTPYHFDPEHNFLLQIRGEKTMHTFDKNDRQMLPEEQLESKYLDQYGGRNLPFQDKFQDTAKSFRLLAGDGVFVPVNMPHWVQNGPQVSISLSVTFYSKDIRRQSRLYRFNGQMRKWGLQPTPVGQSPWIDQAKIASYMTMRSLRNLLPHKSSPADRNLNDSIDLT